MGNRELRRATRILAASAAVFAIAGTGASSPASALVVMVFTDEASFTAALPGPPATEDFESLSSGDSVGVLNGTSFSETVIGESAEATDRYDTSSPVLSLGLDNLDAAFQDGDPLILGFASPVDALGLRIVTSDPVELDELRLETVHGTVLGDAVPIAVQADGGLVYFLGLVSDTPFSEATLAFAADGEANYVYTVDDIVTVPEPGSTLGLFGGVVSLVAMNRRRRSAPRRHAAERGTVGRA